MKSAPFYLLLAILLLGMIACSDPDEPIIDEALLDVVWRIDTLQTPEEEIVPGPDTLMTIQFRENMKISVDTPCNDYWGVYAITKDGSLAIVWHSWTEMACSQGPAVRLGILEGRFIKALDNALVYDVNDSTLILHDSDHRYVIKLKHQ